MASFVKPPQGKTGRPSRAMNAAEAAALLAVAKDHPRIGAYVILSTGADVMDKIFTAAEREG